MFKKEDNLMHGYQRTPRYYKEKRLKDIKETNKKIETLLEAMPYVKKFNNNIIIITINSEFKKLAENLKKNFSEDISLLKMLGLRPIIIHSGDKERVLALSNTLNCKYNSKGNLIISDEIMKLEEIVLSGEINRSIVTVLNYYGIKSIGLSGKDSKFFQANYIDKKEFGLLGIVTEIDDSIILDLLEKDIIPVITPIATGKYGLKSFRVSSSDLAAKLALKINSNKLMFLINEDGILDENQNLISSISSEDATKFINSKSGYTDNLYIREIMRAGIKCVNNGIDKIHIINFSTPHSILLEIFTKDGIGSEIILTKD